MGAQAQIRSSDGPGVAGIAGGFTQMQQLYRRHCHIVADKEHTVIFNLMPFVTNIEHCS